MVDYIVIENHDIGRKCKVPVIFIAADRLVANPGKFTAEVHLQPRGLWPLLIPRVSDGTELRTQDQVREALHIYRLPILFNVEPDLPVSFNLARGGVNLEPFGAHGASGQGDYENAFVIHIRQAWISRRLLTRGCHAAGEDTRQERREQDQRRMQGEFFSAQKTPRRKICSATSRGSRPSVETLNSARR